MSLLDCPKCGFPCTTRKGLTIHLRFCDGVRRTLAERIHKNVKTYRQRNKEEGRIVGMIRPYADGNLPPDDRAMLRCGCGEPYPTQRDLERHKAAEHRVNGVHAV